MPGLIHDVADQFNTQVATETLQRATTYDAVLSRVFEEIVQYYATKEALIGAENLRQAERIILRNVIENEWKSYLPTLRQLNADVTDAAGDTLLHYKQQSSELFDGMMRRIETVALRYLFFMQIETGESPALASDSGASEPPRATPDIDRPPAEGVPDNVQIPADANAPALTKAADPVPSPIQTQAPDSKLSQPPAQNEERLVHDRGGNYRIDTGLTIQQVLACDIVYGQIAAFGFQYLHDNLAQSKEEQTLTKKHFLIVDECDSVLLDDLRVPIVIERKSEQRSHTTHTVQALRRIAALLTPGLDFLIVQDKSVRLTYEGLEAIRRLSGRDFFKPEADGLALGVTNALAAAHVYRRDEDYVIRGAEVLLIERETGRILFGRRYGEGLHEAVEAKEGVPIRQTSEAKTVARITIKNFVETYSIVSGTSGSIGMPEEYRQFYGLEAIEIEPYARTRRDHPDLVFGTRREALEHGVVPLAAAASQRGQPVLINVPSVHEVTEVGDLLNQANVSFQKLDADTVRTLGEESQKIRRAGIAGLATVSSKMAARGTDIMLEPEALAAGGLFVIALGRETNRRYDDQLRGRAGRHGDPGDSVFVLSFEDPLLVLMNPPGWQQVMSKYFGLKEGVRIESKLIARRIRTAQRVLQKRDYDQRFRVVGQDDILDRHRFLFYRVRQTVLTKSDLSAEIVTMLDNWAARRRYANLIEGAPHETASLRPADVFGSLGEFVESTEFRRVLQVKSRKVQSRMMREVLEAKLSRALEAAKLAKHSFGKLILSRLDEQLCRYLTFEAASRDEIRLYAADDPTGLAKYAEAMEQQFDSFFYDVGESVISGVLTWYSTAGARAHALRQVSER
jgi:preprotein translocase subunit SecA